ncbi:hypothetical protein [Dehalobacter sp. 4CP]|uniref:hypothetical protein n=1 Tax=Dehalobacter sp. CP TaxID=2594474 RepID=UPI0039EB8FE9
MAKSIVQYDLLISCPGDIQDELKIINDVITQFNELYTDVLGLCVRTKHWSKNSYAQSGAKPQNLLNKQFVRDCDAAIAIFWTRFGTPTDKYGSGTEEEIEEMLESGKQVFMYFSEKAIQPSLLVSEEYQKVQGFKDKYKDKGIYFTYTSDEAFKKLFLAHLSQYFLSLNKIEQIAQTKCSKISIQSITDNGFSDIVYPTVFNLSGHICTENMLNEAKSLFEKLCSYNVDGNTLSSVTLNSAFFSPVEINSDKQEVIALFAEKLNIKIPENFFSLGNLRENKINSAISIVGGRSFEGNAEEKTRYREINKLYEKIQDILGWAPFENQFKDYKCLKLVVVNDGTTFDEDIDVSLRFPAQMIIQHEDLPIPEKNTLKYITENYSLHDIFGISSTANYNDYKSSKVSNGFRLNKISPPVGLPGFRDYREEYIEDLDDVFEYEYFDDDGYIIVKLHIDYLKHNTAVAFPTVIFITDKISDVSYQITSKFNDLVINGTIHSSEK